MQTWARPFAQGAQRGVALVLGELAGQCDGVKAARQQAGMQMADGIARRAEHQGAGIMQAQQVDEADLDLMPGNADGAIFDIGMRLVAGDGIDAQRVLLVFARQGGDFFGDGGGEEQRAAGFRRGAQDELQLVLEAEIEHLVGFVEHDDFAFVELEGAAVDMVLQPARRADDHVAAGGERTLLTPSIHAANAGHDAPAGGFIKPGKFRMDLQGEFAGGGDDQHHRQDRRRQALRLAHNGGGQGQAVSHCFSRAGLRGDQQIAVIGFGCEHGELYGGGFIVAARQQGAGERRIFDGERHGGS